MSASDILRLVDDMSIKILSLPPLERGKALSQLKEKVLNKTKKELDSLENEVNILRDSLNGFDE